MSQDTSNPDDEGSALPTTDELIALFSDTLPLDALEALRELELDPLSAYNALWVELTDHGFDAEALFIRKGLLESVNQSDILRGFEPRGV